MPLFKNTFYLLYLMLRSRKSLEELAASLKEADLEPEDQAEVEKFINNISHMNNLKQRINAINQIEKEFKNKNKSFFFFKKKPKDGNPTQNIKELK